MEHPISSNSLSTLQAMPAYGDPEIQKALNRWDPEKVYLPYEMRYPLPDWDEASARSAKDQKLKDTLANPAKGAFISLLISAVASTGMMLAPKKWYATIPFTKKLQPETIKKWSIGITATVLASGSLFAAWMQSRMNKEALKGIQAVGTEATRQDWLDYQQTQYKQHVSS